MKKYLFLLIVFLFSTSCETDTICIDETTPHLVIRFYNKDDISKFKKVTNLKVSVKNTLDESVQIGSVSSIDSIALPLNVDLDLTKIYLTKNATDTSDGIENTFILNYSREEVFVSRSCGYKTIYNTINISDSNITNDWITNILVIKTEVDNENQAHLNIFH